MRRTLLSAFVLVAAVASAPAADPLKYLPDDTGAYVHINVKQLLTAPVVRKAVPMAFDKYGDQLVALVQALKQFDANAKEIPDEDIKSAIKGLKNPKQIASSFDAIREFVTDVVIAGDLEENADKTLVQVHCNPALTGLVDLGMTFVEKAEQVKLKKFAKAGQPTIYAIESDQLDKPIFLAVPEPGVVAFGVTKDALESAVAKAKGAKPAKVDKELQAMIARRDPNDFLFMAGIKGAEDDREVSFASLALDKDVSGRFNITYDSDDKAKKGAQQIEEGVTSVTEMIKNFLGDGDMALNEALENVKAKADGKKVSLSVTLPGRVIEKLLSKAKD